VRLIFRPRGRHERSRHHNTRPGHYRSSGYSLLRPWQVRERRFGWTRFGRRGLDPQEVADFLDRVAADLAAVYEALDESRQEAARIKDALRSWQSDQARRLTNAGRFR
jgi:DivIVA domain-containing protein